MKQLRYDMILEAVGPIAHHEGTFGNSAIAMRRKVRQPDGSWCDVPIVTGDAMRHGMREAASMVLLDSAGMLDKPDLGEEALRLLFAGGMITGKGDAGAVKLTQYREMVDLLPHLALFGGCCNNRSVPGRLIVEDALLVCDETRRYVPAWVFDWCAEQGIAIDTRRAHVEEVQRVRMDPALDPGKRALLTEGARANIEGRLLASEEAHDTDDAVGREQNKSTMMPRRFERISTGSLFYWSVEATCYSDLDEDTFNTALAAFLSSARVGGKRATGHGAIRCVTGRKTVLASPANAEETTALTLRVGEQFRAHVQERGEKIAAFLSQVDA